MFFVIQHALANTVTLLNNLTGYILMILNCYKYLNTICQMFIDTDNIRKYQANNAIR